LGIFKIPMRSLKKLFIPHSGNQFHPHLIRFRMLALYCLVLIVSQFALGFFSDISKTKAIAATAISSQEIVNLTNLERQKRELPLLKENEMLKKAAYEKGLDMFADQYWAHVASDGTTPWDFILQAGYDYLYAGENLAKDFTTAEGAVNAWMHSPSHRDNIINSEFQDIGVAVVTGQFKGSETTICVQMLGSLFQQKTVESFSSSETTLSQSLPEAKPDVTSPQPPIILKPQDQAILNDPQPAIEGISESYATVAIYDQDLLLGEVPADSQNAFSYRPPEPFPEGGHVFSAIATDQAGNASGPSFPASVVIDTLAPFIDLGSLEVTPFWRMGEKAIEVRVVVLSDPDQAVARIGDFTLILTSYQKDLYEGVLVPPTEALNQNVVFISAKDRAGNEVETKSSLSAFPEPNPQLYAGSILGEFMSRSENIINKLKPKSFQENIRFFYILFGLVLVLLFGVDSVSLNLKGMQRQSSHSLTHAVFFGLSLLGIIFGSMGVIL